MQQPRLMQCRRQSGASRGMCPGCKTVYPGSWATMTLAIITNQFAHSKGLFWSRHLRFYRTEHFSLAWPIYHWCLVQEAQLSRGGRTMLHVIEYFAKSLNVIGSELTPSAAAHASLYYHSFVTMSLSSSVNLSQCLATHLSASDSFMTIVLYKSFYLLTYLKCTKMHHFNIKISKNFLGIAPSPDPTPSATLTPPFRAFGLTPPPKLYLKWRHWVCSPHMYVSSTDNINIMV